MIIFLKKELPIEKEKALRYFLVEKHVDIIPVQRQKQTLFVVVGRFPASVKQELEKHPSVEKIIQSDRPYKLAGKSAVSTKTIINLSDGVKIGNRQIVIMAGPCSVETKNQIEVSAKEI